MESTYDMNFTSGMVQAQIATASLANAFSGDAARPRYLMLPLSGLSAISVVTKGRNYTRDRFVSVQSSGSFMLSEMSKVCTFQRRRLNNA